MKSLISLLIISLLSELSFATPKFDCLNIDYVLQDRELKTLTAEPLELLLLKNITGNKIVVSKQRRKLYLLRGDVLLRVFDVALGWSPYGPKMAQGDLRTPEGKYIIDFKNRKSSYHLALHISYPNAKDLETYKKFAKTFGFRAGPGGDIMIHGFPNGREAMFAKVHPLMDWTNGCIAVTNREIEELFMLVPERTEIEICPGKAF